MVSNQLLPQTYRYSIHCAVLLLISGGVSAMSNRVDSVVGGVKSCDSQGKLLDNNPCPQANTMCRAVYKICNQNPGTFTKICQTKASQTDTCAANSDCTTRPDDTLTISGGSGRNCAQNVK